MAARQCPLDGGEDHGVRFWLVLGCENRNQFSSPFAEERSSCEKQPHKPVKVAKRCQVRRIVVVREGEKGMVRVVERRKREVGRRTEKERESKREGRTSNVMLRTG